MAVSTEHTKDILMGDGVNTKFPFTFQVIDKNQIRCLKVLASGEEVEILNTEFDVNLNNSGANGGEVTFPLLGEPLKEGIKFIIHRQTAIKQDYTPPNGQVFDAVAVKTEIDRLTMQNQEQEENIERAVKTSMGSDVKPEEYLDNVNDMLANARILQEEAIETTSQNIIDVGVQVKIAKEMASQTTEQATISTKKAIEAMENADRAEVAAELAKGVEYGTILPSGFDATLATPTGGLWCNGAEWTGYNVDGSQGQFSDFYNKLVAGKIKSVSMAEFETAIANAGWCGVCGLDSTNKTFKTPKITNFAQINIVPTAKNKNLGRTLVESYVENGIYVQLFNDGWCEQSGYDNEGTVDNALRTINFPVSFANTNYNVLITKQSENRSNDLLSVGSYVTKNISSFTRRSSYPPYVVGIDWRACGYTFFLTTQPTPNYYIVIYNSAVEASVAQASEFITGLSNKLNKDGSNLEFNPVTKANVTSWGMPDYSRAYKIAQASFPYTMPQNSQVTIQNMGAVGGWLIIDVNGIRVFSDSAGSMNTSNQASTFLASKGDILTYAGNVAIDPNYSYVTPLKGV